MLISGTVGAALQGYVRGCPSIAISVGALRDTRYDVAAAFLGIVVESLKNGASLPPTLVNVNLPNEPAENLKGIRVTRLGRRSYGESVKEDEDIRSMTYRINRDVPLFQRAGAGGGHGHLGCTQQHDFSDAHQHGPHRRRQHPPAGEGPGGLRGQAFRGLNWVMTCRALLDTLPRRV